MVEININFMSGPDGEANRVACALVMAAEAGLPALAVEWERAYQSDIFDHDVVAALILGANALAHTVAGQFACDGLTHDEALRVALTTVFGLTGEGPNSR